MVKKTSTQTQGKGTQSKHQVRRVCGLMEVPLRVLPPDLPGDRLSLIRYHEKKWTNGTVLHYYFFDSFNDGSPNAWTGDGRQKDAVREAFRTWKDLDIGLEFAEVPEPTEAEVRIGFDYNDGSWSAVGRDTVDLVPDSNKRTTNYGWDLTDEYGRDTALHEIGHVLGFPHEHQNPNAGIVWNEEKVYEYYSRTEGWARDKTHWNIIRQLDPNEVAGSAWDRDSIMHYWFPAGLIAQPAELAGGHEPAPYLSQIDINEVRRFYPPLDPQQDQELVPFESKRLLIEPGQQVNLRIRPNISRTYQIQTFGNSDTVMALFEVVDGEPRFYDGDDDSGFDYNASLQVRLYKDREYILRIRLYWTDVGGETAVFLWW